MEKSQICSISALVGSYVCKWEYYSNVKCVRVHACQEAESRMRINIFMNLLLYEPADNQRAVYIYIYVRN